MKIWVLKPSTVEQAKCKYSPLGKIFNKGLSEEDKKEGLLKKLKNIEDKNEQLKINHKTENVKEVTDFIKEPLSQEAIDLIKEIKTIQKNVNYKKLSFTGGNKVAYVLVILKHSVIYLVTFDSKKCQ